MKIVEVGGTCHTLTMSNGETFRISAKETKSIDDSLISKDIERLKDYGDIVIIEDIPVTSKVPYATKSTTTVDTTTDSSKTNK